MQRIDSQDNAKYKGWCKLLTRKYREREGRYLLEGEGRIQEALTQGVAVDAVLIRRGSPEPPWDVPTFDLAEPLFDRLRQTEHGRQQIAVARMMDWTREDILSRPGPLVALDRLQDPGNLGTIIRSADGLGAAGILLLKGTADPYGDKVVRAAAGSLMRTPLVWIEGPEALLAFCRETGRPLVVTCLEDAALPWDTPLSDGPVLVIGNEGAGVSPLLLDQADRRVTIPMTGPIDSLNAGVAASILLYSAMAQQAGDGR